ncbi:DUF916 and DUF3324 domain-containing protein [Enterococcus rotai]|uniref:DUF916 and DUF3324 domain-containing protein n=1 Tax=Enterococcus rotai TaxID=118060 RepID=UPI0035C70BFD
MKKRNTFLLICLFYIVSIIVTTEKTYATGAIATPYTYTVVKPENQEGDVGYFNLRMAPGKKQKVQIELKNDVDKEVTVGVEISQAKTNSNGVIEFGPSPIKDDSSLKFDLKKMVTGPDKVVLPPNQKKVLELTIDMPETSYDGILTGGIHLKVIPTKEEEEEKKKQKGVINEYAYLIGLVLKETDTPINPELELNEVYPGLSNYRNAIFINYSNIQPDFVNDMDVEAQVMKEGSNEILYETKKIKMRMAPNSMIDFPILMNSEKMEPGEYNAHILVSNQEKKWEWTKKFKITKEEADKYNAQDVTLIQERGVDWVLIGLIVSGIIAVFVIIFFIVRVINNSKKKKRKQKKSKKNS